MEPLGSAAPDDTGAPGLGAATAPPPERAPGFPIDGPQAAGPHNVLWDLNDDEGEPVGAATYIARMSVDGQGSSAAVHVTR